MQKYGRALSSLSMIRSHGHESYRDKRIGISKWKYNSGLKVLIYAMIYFVQFSIPLRVNRGDGISLDSSTRSIQISFKYQWYSIKLLKDEV